MLRGALVVAALVLALVPWMTWYEAPTIIFGALDRGGLQDGPSLWDRRPMAVVLFLLAAVAFAVAAVRDWTGALVAGVLAGAAALVVVLLFEATDPYVLRGYGATVYSGAVTAVEPLPAVLAGIGLLPALALIVIRLRRRAGPRPA